METAVRADFRKAFAELSIEMSDITSDVNDGGIPCLDYRVFTTNMFFPRTRQHKCMEPPQVNRIVQNWVVFTRLRVWGGVRHFFSS